MQPNWFVDIIKTFAWWPYAFGYMRFDITFAQIALNIGKNIVPRQNSVWKESVFVPLSSGSLFVKDIGIRVNPTSCGGDIMDPCHKQLDIFRTVCTMGLILPDSS